MDTYTKTDIGDQAGTVSQAAELSRQANDLWRASEILRNVMNTGTVSHEAAKALRAEAHRLALAAGQSLLSRETPATDSAPAEAGGRQPGVRKSSARSAPASETPAPAGS